MWTIRVSDPQGRLSPTVGGQLCPPNSSYPSGLFCTGALFGRNGTAFQATYQGLFWISPDAPGGDWIPRFDPIPGGSPITGNQRLRVTAKQISVATSITSLTTIPTTPANQPLSVLSDSLSLNSINLQSDLNRNAVYWTVRLRDPIGGRLPSSLVGARLCPISSSWPDGPGCTGASANGSGNNVERTYTFLFLISPNAPAGQWVPRMFGPVTGQPDVVGNARIQVGAVLTSSTTIASTTSLSTTTTTPASPQVVSDSFSTSSIALRGTQPSDNQVLWTIRVSDPQGRLSPTVGGQLCPPNSSYPSGLFCTGALFGRNGTAFQATYQGLFWISPDAPGGDWIPRFDPIPGGSPITGNQRLRVTAK